MERELIIAMHFNFETRDAGFARDQILRRKLLAASQIRTVEKQDVNGGAPLANLRRKIDRQRTEYAVSWFGLL